MKALNASDERVREAPPVDRKTALEQTLKKRILSMEIAPGAILDEVALSDEFGMSRPPVRELIRQMAAEGYIELEANRAPRVSSMSHETLRSYFLAAPLIYAATTKLAAMIATPSEIQGLRRIQARFRQAVDEKDVDGRVFYNDLFHRQIGVVAKNPHLFPSLCRLLIDHARQAKTFYGLSNDATMQADLEEAVQQHDDIIDAIERRDPETAEQIVRSHIDLARRRMAMYTAPEGVEVQIEI
ncbi:GntR family transcriptional regulator [Pseudomonas sp. NA-150]|uniref:GntR family transcriptional regulator n=1 Tax=Pseudomonas sp. NA-150 TaxID=3367525 RepID=UPI0037C8D6A1